MAVFTVQCFVIEEPVQSKRGCAEGEFACDDESGACISSEWVCDGRWDCQNGTDERNCGKNIL